MSQEPDDVFEPTLEVLLAPIAALMIKHGMTVVTATDKLKQALVQAAEDEDGTTSDSKISLRTGVHRKDVKRLRGEGGTAARRSKLSAAALAMTRWRQDPQYCDPTGAPRPLYRADDGDQPGFDTLVKLIKADTAPATLLTQLVESNVVHIAMDGLIILDATSLLPQTNQTHAMLEALQATAGLHLAVAAQNVLQDPGAPRHFDRVLRYSHLSKASAAELEQITQGRLNTLLADMNALAYARQQEDADKDPKPDATFAFGAYIASQGATVKPPKKQG